MADGEDPNEKWLKAVDSAFLTPLVCNALNSPTVTVTNWGYKPVSGGVGGGRFDTAIYRFTGQTADQNAENSWSMILKVLRLRVGEDPADPQFWKREAELYGAGLLIDLPGDFRAP